MSVWRVHIVLYVRVCVRKRVHELSVCTFVAVSVVFVFMVEAVNDDSLNPLG